MITTFKESNSDALKIVPRIKKVNYSLQLNDANLELTPHASSYRPSYRGKQINKQNQKIMIFNYIVTTG